jgi:hypothetical protein
MVVFWVVASCSLVKTIRHYNPEDNHLRIYFWLEMISCNTYINVAQIELHGDLQEAGHLTEHCYIT